MVIKKLVNMKMTKLMLIIILLKMLTTGITIIVKKIKGKNKKQCVITQSVSR